MYHTILAVESCIVCFSVFWQKGRRKNRKKEKSCSNSYYIVQIFSLQVNWGLSSVCVKHILHSGEANRD